MHFDSFAVLGEQDSFGLWDDWFLSFICVKNDTMTSIVCDAYAVILASQLTELPTALRQQNIDTIFA